MNMPSKKKRIFGKRVKQYQCS